MQYYTFLNFQTKGSFVSTDTFMIRKNISETKQGTGTEEQSKIKGFRIQPVNTSMVKKRDLANLYAKQTDIRIYQL